MVILNVGPWAVPCLEPSGFRVGEFLGSVQGFRSFEGSEVLVLGFGV